MKDDPQLSDLLRQWKAPTVSGHFDQDVWRRIRQRKPEPVPAWWQLWIASPLRLGVVTALLVVALGGWAGRQSTPVGPPAFAFGGGNTVTGAYLHLTKGARP